VQERARSKGHTMSGWFGTDDKDTYQVTGITRGWFGESKISEKVIGRREADRLADRMRSRGDRDVQVKRDGWWAF
jgi:hypothetical protein